MKRLTITILSVLFLTSIVLAEEIKIPIDEGGKVANPPESLQLEYKFKVGEYRRYDMVMIGEGHVLLPGQKEKSKLEARSEFTFAQHCDAYVPKDGIWRMEWDMIRGVLNLPEFGEITLTIPSLQFEMDKYGKINKVTGLEELAVAPGLPQQDSMAKTLEQLTALGFPRKELKVGDTWEREYKIEIKDQEPVLMKTTSKLLGYEIMDEADCAIIVTTYETPFKLTDKPAADEESKPAGAGDATETDKETPTVLTGVEKGEFTVHFAYTEGKIMRTDGILEVTADPEGKKASAIEIPIPKDASPEVAAELKAENLKAKHDISIKYTMTSVFNPKMPETAVEKPK